MYQFVILWCMFLKVFEFMQADPTTSLITQMFLEVIVDIYPFMQVFAWVIFIFATFFAIFEIRPCEDGLSGFKCNGDEDSYPGLQRFVMMYITTFRESVGDINAPNYESWLDRMEDNPKTSTVAIYTIWVVWFLNVFVTLIVMLNFLIAEVGATYARVTSLGIKNHYKQ